MEEMVPVDSVPTSKCQHFRSSASNPDETVLRMETCLPDRSIFDIFIGYTKRFKGSMSLSLDDQISWSSLITTPSCIPALPVYLHLCDNCSTYIHPCSSRVVVVKKDTLTTVPSREKNLSLPSSFQMYRNCRMVINCTNVVIATPASVELQKHTYSSNRGMGFICVTKCCGLGMQATVLRKQFKMFNRVTFTRKCAEMFEAGRWTGVRQAEKGLAILYLADAGSRNPQV